MPPEAKDDRAVSDLQKVYADLIVRVVELEKQVRGLVPLHELVPHISQIKRTFGAGS